MQKVKNTIVGAKTSTLDDKCFNVSIDTTECFNVSIQEDNCFDVEDFEIPKEIEKKLPFDVIAIHYRHSLNRLYMVIREKAENKDDDCVDEFAIVNYTDNGKYGYIPPYKFESITKVTDYNGNNIEYSVKTLDNGVEYIELTQDRVGMFKVYYKATLLTKIAEYDFIITLDNKIILYQTGKESHISKTLVGSDCILMGHESDKTNSPLLFRDKNGESWRVEQTDLSISRLNFNMPSYMVDENIAYNDLATGAYDIDNNIGYDTWFKRETVLNRDVIGKLSHFMQDKETGYTLAFFKPDDLNFLQLRDYYKYITFMPYLQFEGWREEIRHKEWSGVGATGATINTGNDRVVEEIEINPQIPQITNPHWQGGLFYNISSMQPKDEKVYIIGKRSEKLDLYNFNIADNKKRITANNAHFIVVNGFLYKLTVYPYFITDNSSLLRLSGEYKKITSIDNGFDYTVTNNKAIKITQNGLTIIDI